MKIFFSSGCLDYEEGGHPESPDRLKVMYEYLKNRYEFLEAKPCSHDELLLVHTEGLVNAVKENEPSFFDADTPNIPGIYDYARLAAGSAVQAARSAIKGGRAFSLMRPPGHHAGRDFLGGFCYFNNIAVASRFCQEVLDVRKILILDIDCHAGNGTIDIFKESKNVLYISLHEWPLFPGTGWIDEIGENEGKGYTVNIPLFPGTGDDVYLEALREIALPLIEQFKPELIGISAGFDTHKNDLLTNMNLTLSIYHGIGELLSGFRKVFVVLEGGYNLDVLPKAAENLISGLEGEGIKNTEKPTRSDKNLIENTRQRILEIKSILQPYWKLE